jgi:hypothetical protein
MIEVTQHGRKKLIRTKDIRDVREYCDTRYPSINCIITLYDGIKIECVEPYHVIRKLIAEDNYIFPVSLESCINLGDTYINHRIHNPIEQWRTIDGMIEKQGLVVVSHEITRLKIEV